MKNIVSVYFSATYTTRKIIREIADAFDGNVKEYDITAGAVGEDVSLESHNDILIVGMPVYAGRIPSSAAEALEEFRGNGTPAIIVCVYGNREYDDALIEIKDIVESNGFKVISAGAFIAQHSIFPAMGAGRPDSRDMEVIRAFGQKSKELSLNISELKPLEVKGRRPYKVPRPIPLHPKGNFRCDKCGACVRLCPAEAISPDNPKKTNKEKCMSCGRCLIVCHNKSRRFRGLAYKIASRKFVKAYSGRKEPELFYGSISIDR